MSNSTSTTYPAAKLPPSTAVNIETSINLPMIPVDPHHTKSEEAPEEIMSNTSINLIDEHRDDSIASNYRQQEEHFPRDDLNKKNLEIGMVKPDNSRYLTFDRDEDPCVNMNEFDRFVRHESFRGVLEATAKLKMLKDALSKDISEMPPIQLFQFESTHEVDSTVAAMRQYCSPNHSFVTVPRGTFPYTDSLLDEAIESLQEEFNRCLFIASEIKKSAAAVASTSNPTKQFPPKKLRKKSSGEAIAVKYSKRQTDVLTHWMIDNRTCPFPAQSEIKMLCEATGLAYTQVVNWTTNVRKRNLKATVEGGKKPHHFLDFLFLAEDREKRLHAMITGEEYNPKGKRPLKANPLRRKPKTTGQTTRRKAKTVSPKKVSTSSAMIRPTSVVSSQYVGAPPNGFHHQQTRGIHNSTAVMPGADYTSSSFVQHSHVVKYHDTMTYHGQGQYSGYYPPMLPMQQYSVQDAPSNHAPKRPAALELDPRTRAVSPTFEESQGATASGASSFIKETTTPVGVNVSFDSGATDTEAEANTPENESEEDNIFWSAMKCLLPSVTSDEDHEGMIDYDSFSVARANMRRSSVISTGRRASKKASITSLGSDFMMADFDVPVDEDGLINELFPCDEDTTIPFPI